MTPANVRPDPRRHRVVCKHWLRGLCKKGDTCDFLHRLDHDRMPECWYFSNFGECGNKECIFLHVRPDEKASECPWYARGFCKHGQRCRHRHTLKKPCPKYLAGFCPDGPACSLGHPKYAAPPGSSFSRLHLAPNRPLVLALFKRVAHNPRCVSRVRVSVSLARVARAGGSCRRCHPRHPSTPWPSNAHAQDCNTVRRNLPLERPLRVPVSTVRRGHLPCCSGTGSPSRLTGPVPQRAVYHITPVYCIPVGRPAVLVASRSHASYHSRGILSLNFRKNMAWWLWCERRARGRAASRFRGSTVRRV